MKIFQNLLAMAMVVGAQVHGMWGAQHYPQYHTPSSSAAQNACNMAGQRIGGPSWNDQSWANNWFGTLNFTFSSDRESASQQQGNVQQRKYREPPALDDVSVWQGLGDILRELSNTGLDIVGQAGNTLNSVMSDTLFSDDHAPSIVLQPMQTVDATYKSDTSPNLQRCLTQIIPRADTDPVIAHMNYPWTRAVGPFNTWPSARRQSQNTSNLQPCLTMMAPGTTVCNHKGDLLKQTNQPRPAHNAFYHNGQYVRQDRI